jgi:hypothetical protein
MGASELITTPPEAEQRLEALSRYWNALRNAALGRSTRPLVSDALADHVASEHLGYHAWRDSLPAGMLTGITVSWADDLRDWTRRANEVRASIRVERPDLLLPAPLAEYSEGLPAQVTVAVASVFSGLGGVIMGAGLLYLWSLRK